VLLGHHEAIPEQRNINTRTSPTFDWRVPLALPVRFAVESPDQALANPAAHTLSIEAGEILVLRAGGV
jgi:hypothetical protein